MKAIAINNLLGVCDNTTPKRFAVVCEAEDEHRSFALYSEAFEHWQQLKMEFFSRYVDLMDEERNVRCTCSPEEFYFGTFFTGLEIDPCSFNAFKDWYLATHHGEFSEDWLQDAYKSACKIWNRCTKR